MAAFGSTRRKRQLDAKETAKVEGGNVAAMEAVEELLAKAGDKAAAAGMTKVCSLSWRLLIWMAPASLGMPKRCF